MFLNLSLAFLTLAGGMVVASCSHWAGQSATARAAQYSQTLQDDQVTLEITSEKTLLEPGEPFICRLTLRNQIGAPLQIPMPNYASVAFYVRHIDPDSDGGARLIEPVHSDKEPIEQSIDIPPLGAMEREFVFVTLSLKRGEYSLLPVYTRQGAGPEAPPEKAYGIPLKVTVTGDQVWVHRDLNGLVTADDAATIARRHFGIEAASTETRLIRDEMGFEQWWVNVTPDPAPQNGTSAEGTRSCFVSPYLAAVWREAEPFAREDLASPFPDDSLRAGALKSSRWR